MGIAEENLQAQSFRRRRVQRLKKYIILTLMLAITIPIVLCVVMLFRIRSLENTIGQLAIQLEELREETKAAGQEKLSDGQAERPDGRDNQTAGQGYSVVSEAGRELPGYELEQQSPDEVTEPGQEEAIKAGHRVYLTFDDGPSVYTEDILDILDRYDVKATFFVVGKETDSAKEALRDIVERGHTLGMHSYSHKYSEIYASVDAFAEDFVKLRDYLKEVTGVESMVYRFPGGSSNTVSTHDMWDYADYLEECGVRFFDWNIASGDGGSVLLPVETLVKNVTEDIPKNGTSVILLHDSGEKRTTVEALPVILENILAMEDTVILPITEDTEPVQHIHRQADESARQTKE